MQLLELPTELLQQVMGEVVRGVDVHVVDTSLIRTLQLRLVCRVFEEFITNDLLDRPAPTLRYEGACLLAQRPFFVKFLKRKLDVNVITERKCFLSALIEGVIEMLGSVQQPAGEVHRSKRELLRMELIESVADQLSIIKVVDMLDREYLDGEDLEGDILHGAMVVAASRNDISTMKELVSKGAKVDSKSTYFGEISIAAARNGAVEVIEYLLDNTPEKINIRDGHNLNYATWRHEAAFAAGLAGHEEVLRLILSPTPERTCIRDSIWGNRDSGIQGAIRGRHYELVRFLWKETGEDIEKWKRKTLEHAARFGALPIIEELIEAGTTFISGQEGYTRSNKLPPEIGSNKLSLEIASRHGRTSIVQYLLQKGAGGNRTKHRNALHYAAQFGHTDVVRLLIDDGADVNTMGTGGPLVFFTPLRFAARLVMEGCEECVVLLLRGGARFYSIHGGRAVRKAEELGRERLVGVYREFGVVDDGSV